MPQEGSRVDSKAVQSGEECVDLLSAEEGLPKGLIIDWAGSWGKGKTTALFECLSRTPHWRVAWVGEKGQRLRQGVLSPWLFLRHGIQWERWVWIDLPDEPFFLGQGIRSRAVRKSQRDAEWVIHQLVRSQAFDCILVEGVLRASENFDEKTELFYRRLQIEAKRAKSTLLFLGEEPLPASLWPVGLQVFVDQDENASRSMRILKSRGRSFSSLTARLFSKFKILQTSWEVEEERKRGETDGVTKKACGMHLVREPA